MLVTNPVPVRVGAIDVVPTESLGDNLQLPRPASKTSASIESRRW